MCGCGCGYQYADAILNENMREKIVDADADAWWSYPREYGIYYLYTNNVYFETVAT